MSERPHQHDTNPVLNFRSERLTRREAAEYLGFAESSLASFAYTGAHDIPYVRVGGKIFYLRHQLDQWLTASGVRGADWPQSRQIAKGESK